MRFLILAALLAACGGSPADATAPKSASVTPAKAAPAEKAPVAKETPKAAPAATGEADLANGEKVYGTYCVACHQKDGTGMNGMLAGNFVADKTRLAKPDAELLSSIADGVQGKIGLMPPWGATLSQQEMVDVLGFVRKRFGE